MSSKPKELLDDFTKAQYKPLPKDNLDILELRALIDAANIHFDLAGLETSYTLVYAEEDGKQTICVLGDTTEEQILAAIIYIAPDGQLELSFGFNLEKDNLSQKNTNWKYINSVVQEALFRILPTEQQHRFNVYKAQEIATGATDINNHREFG